MYRLLRTCLLLGIAWFFLHCLWLVNEGSKHFKGNADVAIVLGNTVFANDSLAEWTQGRVEAALKLYRAGQVKKIFVSGGTGTSAFPEGDGMRDYLVCVGGVDSADVIIDNYGNNSYLTAKNFIALNEQQHFKSAVIVTSYFHINRSKYIIRKLGFSNLYGEPSEYTTIKDWFYMLREFVAYYKYMIVY
ncbi:MAG: YdcF family protein [Chitinophagaceae bacterium]